MLAVEERLVASAVNRGAEGAAVIPEPVVGESLRGSLQNLPTLLYDQAAG